MSFDGKRLVQPFAAARPLTVIEVNSTSQAIGWSLDLSSQNGIRPATQRLVPTRLSVIRSFADDGRRQHATRGL
jgi:hypothetical protein